MAIEDLSHDQLVDSALAAVAEERRVSVSVLNHFMEIEKRRLYAARGYSSLWEYATKFFGYSEGAAYRRINAMRLMTKTSGVAEKIASGELSMTVAAAAESFIRQTESDAADVVAMVKGQSSREAERTFFSLVPSNIPRERVRTLTAEHLELRLVVDLGLKAKLDKVRDFWAHRKPNMEYVEVVEDMADFTILKLRGGERRSGAPSAPNVDKSGSQYEMDVASPNSVASTSTPQEASPKLDKSKASGPKKSPALDHPYAPKPMPRQIPKATRDKVFERDKHRCTFKDKKTGKVCGSTYMLEIDHILPWSLGGTNEPSNLRVLCRTHNQFLAQERFGDRRSALGTRPQTASHKKRKGPEPPS